MKYKILHILWSLSKLVAIGFLFLATNIFTSEPQEYAKIATVDFAPDGKSLVFGWARDDNFDLFQINKNGSELKKLTDSPSNEYFPDFSPDGKKIAFNSDRDGTWDIYVLDLETNIETQLTRGARSEWAPRFSPDGTRISFYDEGRSTWNIFLMKADGTDPVNLTHRAQPPGPLRVLPVYTIVYYASPFLVAGENIVHLFQINSDGTEQLQISEGNGKRWHPHLSPDDKNLIYSMDIKDDTHLFISAADGSGSVQVTQGRGINTFSSWAPDGKSFAFTGSTAHHYGIFIVNADTLEIARIFPNEK